MAADIGISVVVGTYNHGRYIGECLQSVLDQTYRNVEVIVIDDGSTDDTRQAVEPFIDRITYVYQENQGRAAARNHGIQKARFDWIAIIDADDLWEPTKLEKQVAAIHKHPQIDIIVTNACFFKNDQVIVEDFFAKMVLMHRTPVIEDGTLRIFEDKLFPLFIRENFVNQSSILLRKKCFETEGLYNNEYKRCEDRDLWLRLARRFTFAYLSEVLTRTRTHSLGDGPGTDQPIKWRIRVLQDALARDTEWERKYRRDFMQVIGRTYFELGYFYFARQNNSRRSRKSFASSIAHGYHHPLVWLYYASTFLPGSLARLLRRIKQTIR